MTARAGLRPRSDACTLALVGTVGVLGPEQDDMPTWTQLDLDYRPYGRGSEPFARAGEGFPAGGLGKSARAAESARQAHFEAELLRIAEAVGGDVLPVFIRFRGERRRMDRGCVGHAVARGLIERPVDGPEGIVASVVLRGRGEGGRPHG